MSTPFTSEATPPAGVPPRPSSSSTEPPLARRGFLLEEAQGSETLSCGDVRGFREASAAAVDARAQAPQRLVIVAPEPETATWLAAWSEDAERVRRTVSFCRQRDGREVIAVVTLCAYGPGTETALSVESVSAPNSRSSDEIFRSGVHAKVDIAAALARYDAEVPLADPVVTQ